MVAARTSWRRIGVALLLWVGSSGCAGVVGIEEFSLKGAEGPGGGGGPVVDVCTAVHGCTREGAEDLRAASTVHISFGDAGYDPRCILVRSDKTMSFEGNFAQVPIAGGVSPNEDPDSPIKNPTDPTAMVAPFVLSGACAFPYFSPMTGQTGAIFLE
jgi:hypothetical protein